MPVKIFIVGIGGFMGRVTAELCRADKRFELVGGLDAYAKAADCPCPLFLRAKDAALNFDAIVDFSHPSLLPELHYLAEHSGKPLVVATTGYDAEQLTERERLSESVPLFTSANMSLGVNLLRKLAADAARTLYPAGYDIEISEAHHRRKLDAPSGTALWLADSLRAALGGELEYCCGRAERRQARPRNEIGLSSIRGGTIVGEHEVIFAGEDEVIKLSHSAGSRRIFAAGALEAALFLQDKPAGHYSMDELLDAVLNAKK